MTKKHTSTAKPRKPPGPAPEVLKIEGDWKDAVKKALRVKKPVGGWPGKTGGLQMETSSRLRDHPTVGVTLSALVWSQSSGKADRFPQVSSEAGILKSAKVGQQANNWELQLVREIKGHDQRSAVSFEKETIQALTALFESRLGKPLSQILDLRVNAKLEVAE
jgi:hypothetical protein